MVCENKTVNLKNCNCTCMSCGRRGICCECIDYHRKRNELPACYFSTREESTWDRSISHFIQTSQQSIIQ